MRPTSRFPNVRAPRKYLWGALAASALLVGGCASNDASTSGASRSWGETWERVRRAIAVGNAFDRGVLAARDENAAKFEEARRELARLDADANARRLASRAPLSPAELEVARALVWSQAAQRAGDSQQKQQLEAREAQAYRRALEVAGGSGRFASSNATLLNALGYFLADKGTTPADFAEAERLTRRALELQEEDVAAATKRDGAGSTQVLEARFSRANTRDSLAWALYQRAFLKQTYGTTGRADSGLLAQALREQEAAVAEAREVVAALKPQAPSVEVSAELLLHLASIIGAQDRSSVPLGAPEPPPSPQVQKLLREALELDPNLEAARTALKQAR